MGRSRTTSPSDPELAKLGKEMIKWVKENDPLHLSEWYSIEKMFTYNQWKAMIQHKIFLPYYEQALMIVGRKYLDKNSNVRDSISHRWLRVYFKEFKEAEDEAVLFKAEAARKEKEQDQQDYN